MGDELQMAKTTLARYAINSPEKIRDKYYYGTIDGNVWKQFLEQFDVHPKDTPQIFILNMNSKKYWQNETYKLNVDDFLQATEDGTVEAKSAGPKGMEGVLVKFYNFMIAYRPWSLVLVVLLVVAFGVLICKCVKPGEDLRPPYLRELEKSEKEEESREKPEKEEGKKEK